MSMICVGTPSKRSGDLDLDYIEAVTREIGEVIKRKNARHTIVVRSTVLPGTVNGLVVPLLEKASGKLAGVRSEEHTSELQSLMRNSYAVFCLKKKKTHKYIT